MYMPRNVDRHSGKQVPAMEMDTAMHRLRQDSCKRRNTKCLLNHSSRVNPPAEEEEKQDIVQHVQHHHKQTVNEDELVDRVGGGTQCCCPLFVDRFVKVVPITNYKGACVQTLMKSNVVKWVDRDVVVQAAWAAAKRR